MIRFISHFWLYGVNREILTFFDLHCKKGPVFIDHVGPKKSITCCILIVNTSVLSSEMFLEVRYVTVCVFIHIVACGKCIRVRR